MATEETPAEIAHRQKLLDRVKADIFQGSDAAFQGPLMASLNFVWTDQIDTSATDYESIFWNPKDFDRLTHTERVASLMHELGHNYRLHGLRQGDRDQATWNIAADIIINRGLKDSGYDVDNQWFVGQHRELKGEVEEDLYEELMNQPPASPPQPAPGQGQPKQGQSGQDQSGQGQQSSGQPSPEPAAKGKSAQAAKGRTCSCHQMPPVSKEKAQKALQNVVQATQQAKLSGNPGAIPGDVEQLFNKFLKPKIAWEAHIQQWLTEHLDTRLTYQRPSRRYLAHGMLIKGRVPDEGALEHLVWAFDVSGSITDDMIHRFNSEMKYVKDTYHPKKMTLLLFDTKIRKVVVIEEDDEYTELEIVGRGGTDLREVGEYLEKERATAALIFSDLECTPMKKMNIPIIWVCIGNPYATVNSGKLIRIPEERRSHAG